MVYEILIDYIRPAIVRYSNCKQNLSDRDDIMQRFNFALTDTNKEILIRYVVINWIEANFINVPSMLKTQLISKEFNATHSVELLDKLINLRDRYILEIENLISKNSYKNSTLFNIR